jgi:NADH-ubiquinone oxidoreductase chain 2
VGGADSAISHVGFLLLALAINSIESVQPLIFYLMQYSCAQVNLFFILIIIGYSLFEINSNNDPRLSDRKHSPLQLISQLKGYFYHNPYLSLCLAIAMFSLAGIPPLIGFFAKQAVLLAALQEGYYFLVLIAVLTSVIGVVYYLAIVKEVFFVKPDYKTPSELGLPNTVRTSSSLSIVVAVLTLIILFFMFNPTQLLRMASILALSLFVT